MNSLPPPSGPPYGSDGSWGDHGHGGDGFGSHAAGGGVQRDLGATVSLLLTLFGRGRRAMLRTVWFVLVPYQIAASVLLSRSMEGVDLDAIIEGGAVGDASGLLMTAGMFAIGGLLANLVVAGAIVAIAHAGDLQLSVGTALRIGFDRSGATVGAAVVLIVILLTVAFSSLLVFVPVAAMMPVLGLVLIATSFFAVAVAIAIGTSLVVPVAVLEAAGPLRTVRRVAKIAWARRGRVLGLAFALGAVMMVIGLFATMIIAALTLAVPALAGLLDAVFVAAMSLLTAPLTALAGYVVWLDAVARES